MPDGLRSSVTDGLLREAVLHSARGVHFFRAWMKFFALRIFPYVTKNPYMPPIDFRSESNFSDGLSKNNFHFSSGDLEILVFDKQLRSQGLHSFKMHG